MDYFDLSNGHGSLEVAFADSAHIMYLVVSFTSDWLYPTYHSKEMVSALTCVGADVTFCNLQSTWGHDAFLLEVDTMTHLISDFLDRVVAEHGINLPPAPTAVRRASKASLPDFVIHDDSDSFRDLRGETYVTMNNTNGLSSRADLRAIAELIRHGRKGARPGLWRWIALALLDGHAPDHGPRHRNIRAGRAGVCAQGLIACGRATWKRACAITRMALSIPSSSARRCRT